MAMQKTLEAREMGRDEGGTMRYPTKGDGAPNVGFYTLREVRNALRLEVDRLQEQGDLKTETSRGWQVPDKTDYINWILCGVFGLSEVERDRLIRWGKARFELLQRSKQGTFDLFAPDGEGSAPDVKGFPGRVQSGKHGRKGKDLAPIADHAPGH